VARPFSTFNRQQTLFIFVSHRWRNTGGGNAADHPDEYEDHPKHKLIVEACKRLRSHQGEEGCPIPAHFEIALWIDFACVDQDGAPGDDLANLVADVIQVCDMLITPVVDRNHESWSLPQSIKNAILEYKAAAWQDYWLRAWCRVEAFLGSVSPLVEDHGASSRSSHFQAGLHAAFAAGRRGHVIFGTKELEEKRMPLFLPPLLFKHYKEHMPSKGTLTKEEDRKFIQSLEVRSQCYLNHALVGYKGARNASKQRHGRGIEIFENGDVYDGQWANGHHHGHGIYRWSWGDIYDGDWYEGKMHGFARHEYADGGVFIGVMQNNKREGRGVFLYSKGDELQGFYSADYKERCLWFFKNGECMAVRFTKASQPGSTTFTTTLSGEGVWWSADRKCAWRLLNGEKTQPPISLQEAARILESLQLGLPYSVPPIRDHMRQHMPDDVLAWIRTDDLTLLSLDEPSTDLRLSLRETTSVGSLPMVSRAPAHV